jgi:putative toxin-antitoxin system antitoxin component (TIGR02293 family)
LATAYLDQRENTSQAGHVARLLGVDGAGRVDDVALADHIAGGLMASAAEGLIDILGRGTVIGRIVPEATFRRHKSNRKVLSRAMSERLYEVGRVVVVAEAAYRGDSEGARRFLVRPHPLLDGRTPLDLAIASSAGADAVINLLHKADAGFAI